MKKLSVISLVLLVLFYGCGGDKSYRYAPGSVEIDENAAANLSNSFFEEEKMMEIVDAVDVLANLGVSNIYHSEKEMLDSNRSGRTVPAVMTSLDIYMLFSVLKLNDNYYYHYSLSSSDYMATIIRKTITGFFCARTGLPAPEYITCSQNGVTHAEWTLTGEEHDTVCSNLKQLKPATRDEVYMEALKRSLDLEIKTANIPSGSK